VVGDLSGPGALLIVRCLGAVREPEAGNVGTFVFADVIPGECTLQVLAGTGNRTVALVFGAGGRRLVEVEIDLALKRRIDPALRVRILGEGGLGRGHGT
jgi:hypothetical protein